MSDKLFENEMRDRLDTYRSEVDHNDLWNKVEADLYPKKRGRGLIWWWVSSGTLLLLLIGVMIGKTWTSGAVPLAGNPATEPTTSEPTAQTAEIKLEASVGSNTLTTIGETDIVNEQLTEVPPAGPEASERNLEGPANRSSTPGLNQLITPVRQLSGALSGDAGASTGNAEGPVDLDAIPALNQQHVLLQDDSALLTDAEGFDGDSEVSTIPTFLYTLDNSITGPEPSPLPRENTNGVENLANNSFRRWSISPHIFAGKPRPIIGNQNDDIFEDPFSDLGAMGVGLNIGHYFHPRWSIHTGLDYRQLLTRFNGNQLVSREEEEGIVFTERIIYADGQVIERTGTGTRTTSTYRRTRLTNRLHTLNLPLLLQYESNASAKALSWYVQGGLLLNLRHQIEGLGLNREGELYDLAESGEYKTKIGFGLQLGAGISRPLTKSMDWQLGVELRRLLESSTTELSVYQRQFNLIGIKAGLSWRF